MSTLREQLLFAADKLIRNDDTGEYFVSVVVHEDKHTVEYDKVPFVDYIMRAIVDNLPKDARDRYITDLQWYKGYQTAIKEVKELLS